MQSALSSAPGVALEGAAGVQRFMSSGSNESSVPFSSPGKKRWKYRFKKYINIVTIIIMLIFLSLSWVAICKVDHYHEWGLFGVIIICEHSTYLACQSWKWNLNPSLSQPQLGQVRVHSQSQLELCIQQPKNGFIVFLHVLKASASNRSKNIEW